MLMRIKTLRKKSGLTQTELADKIGVMQNTVSNWEQELIFPRAPQLPKLARVLGVSIDDLFTDSTLKQPDGLPAIGDIEKAGTKNVSNA